MTLPLKAFPSPLCLLSQPRPGGDGEIGGVVIYVVMVVVVVCLRVFLGILLSAQVVAAAWILKGDSDSVWIW